jgi:alpha-galactosidase
VQDIPPQLVALQRTNINVQELHVAALLTENREHIYHAPMLDPHTGGGARPRPDLDARATTSCSPHGEFTPDAGARPSPAAGRAG